MNKTRRRAVQKHRAADRKYEERRKATREPEQSAAALRAPAPAAPRPRPAPRRRSTETPAAETPQI